MLISIRNSSLHIEVCVIMLRLHGGVTKVSLTPELPNSTTAAKSRYSIHVENERRKKESEAQGQQRRVTEEHLEQLKKSRSAIQEVSEGLA